MERAADLDNQLSGVGKDLNALIEKYGEDSARYLYQEMLIRFRQPYKKLVYIRTGLEPDDNFLDRARAEAQEKKWIFEEVVGSPNLFRRLLAGDWQKDFLVVPPGYEVAATYDEAIVTAVPNKRIPSE